MTAFPHFDHFAVKLLFDAKEKITNDLAQVITDRIAQELKLTVLDTYSYQFQKQGLTRVLVLSQSHLICHTWPEFGAIHIDLVTCSKDIDFPRLTKLLEEFKPQELQVNRLEY